MSCIMTDKDDAPEDAAPESSVKGAQTLMRALDILDEVIDRPIRAADLARKLGMNRTTAHRLAHALRTRDYLSVTPEGFALGPKLLQLGVLASEQTDYLRVARPGWRRCRRTRVSASSSATARQLVTPSRPHHRAPASARGDGAGRPPPDRGNGPGKALLDDTEASWKKLWKQAAYRACHR
jgi:DNA-binding IclR family transcriptional regulator